MLMAVSEPRRNAAWLGLALTLFSAYQIRPIYLFLVGFVPLLGCYLALVRSGGISAVSWLKLGGKLFLGCVAPLAIFLVVRYHVVGDVGLVAFRGIASIGVPAEMLDNKGIAKMPAHFRVLALTISRQRDAWDTPRGVYPKRDITGDWYDLTTWRIVAPFAFKWCHGDWLAMDDLLRKFGAAAINAKRWLYALWVQDAFLAALVTSLKWQINDLVYVYLVLGMLAMISHFVARIAKAFFINPLGGQSAPVPKSAYLIWVVGLSLFFVQIALIAILQRPIARYVDAAAVFFPSMLAMVLYADWVWLGQIFGSSAAVPDDRCAAELSVASAIAMEQRPTRRVLAWTGALLVVCLMAVVFLAWIFWPNS
ncbi:MAG: hypothetical protein N3A66_03475, partial [Planctomycetota bacterium]|nr:hypothetical protein [Planctomycetota bacterium]